MHARMSSAQATSVCMAADEQPNFCLAHSAEAIAVIMTFQQYRLETCAASGMLIKWLSKKSTKLLEHQIDAANQAPFGTCETSYARCRPSGTILWAKPQ